MAGLFLGVLAGCCACKSPEIPPEVTNTPVPSVTDSVIPTSEPENPTEVPAITEPPATPTTVPSVTPESLPTDTPMPTEDPTAVPTKEPEMTATATPEPEVLPTAEPTPELSGTTTPEPVVSPTEEPTATPTPEPVTPTPEPTGQPAYDTLLQNGWQRTEDFFGCREIFFSGRFDRTELIAVPGRYEYRYTASSDAEGVFSVIGEEELAVQQFLDELVQESPDCTIEWEAEQDYRYCYTDGEYTVTGRIYACDTEEKVRRMRVEVRVPGTEESPAEGYEFYLKER